MCERKGCIVWWIGVNGKGVIVGLMGKGWKGRRVCVVNGIGVIVGDMEGAKGVWVNGKGVWGESWI